MHRCLVRTGRIVCNAEKGLCNGTLSVRVSVPALQVALCCGPARSARDIDRLLHGRHSAVAAGERGQCHVVGVRRKLNADVFLGFCVQLLWSRTALPFAHRQIAAVASPRPCGSGRRASCSGGDAAAACLLLPTHIKRADLRAMCARTALAPRRMVYDSRSRGRTGPGYSVQLTVLNSP